MSTARAAANAAEEHATSVTLSAGASAGDTNLAVIRASILSEVSAEKESRIGNLATTSTVGVAGNGDSGSGSGSDGDGDDAVNAAVGQIDSTTIGEAAPAEARKGYARSLRSRASPAEAAMLSSEEREARVVETNRKVLRRRNVRRIFGAGVSAAEDTDSACSASESGDGASSCSEGSSYLASLGPTWLTPYLWSSDMSELRGFSLFPRSFRSAACLLFSHG